MLISFAKRLVLLFLCLTSIVFFFIRPSCAVTNEEMNTLLLFYKEEDLVITPTRQPKPLSQVAENITVVTAEEIAMINAHTLADVLNHIPGVQMDIRGGPGSIAYAHIQGSEFSHVLVMVDGVTLNNLSDNSPDISAIPVQYIERVEIIKGPGSSSWGSSLGGVINVITKPTGNAPGSEGMLSGSYGERETRDLRAEFTGMNGRLGYYVHAGNLYTDGFTGNTNYDADNLYTKLRLDGWDGGGLTFTLGYNKGDRGMGEFGDLDMSFDHEFESLFSTLSMDHAFSPRADAHLSVRTLRQDGDFIMDQISTGMELQRNTAEDSVNGGTATITWRCGAHTAVVGADIDEGKLESLDITGGEQTLRKWALFANDTIAVNRFSLIPGIRYDHTNTNGDFVSPSIGMTFKATERTLLRAYTARGFNTPSLSSTFGSGFFSLPNPDLDVEKVWSAQAGVETTELRCVWIKATLFHHRVSDALSKEDLLDPNGTPTGMIKMVNGERQRRQGVEVEVRTMPVYNISLLAGFSFVDATDRDTGERLPDTPRYTYDVGIHYNNPRLFTAYLAGHYIWWHASPANDGKFDDFVWDLNLAKRVWGKGSAGLDAFLSVHNIFNASQYTLSYMKNPRRWAEAGVRFRF